MQFDFNISITEIILLALCFIAMLVLVLFYRWCIERVARRVVQCRQENSDLINCPPLSVIVYDRDSVRNLAAMLPRLLEQNYPEKYEIIVVTDGRSENIEDVVKKLAVDHRNLRFTYVPDEAHYISRKKLAITLGIKAAKYDYVLLTDADIVVPSDSWLRNMCRHFTLGKNVVIGFARPFEKTPTKGKNKFAWFDVLIENISSLTAAIAGRVYRGNVVNLAFKKQLFYDKKGFSDSLSFHHGEDDIFVCNLVDKEQSAVELSPDAQVDHICYDFKSQHNLRKLNRVFTGKYVSHTYRRLFGLCSAMMWLWLLASIAALIVSLPNLFPLAVILILGLAWIIPVVFAIKKTASSLVLPFSGWLTPICLFVHPFYNLYYKFKATRHKSKNYTWSKPLK